jgi:hypothetical protein
MTDLNLPALREAVATSRLPRSAYPSDSESFGDALRRVQRLEAARKVLVDAAPALLDEIERLRLGCAVAGQREAEYIFKAEADLAAARAVLDTAREIDHPVFTPTVEIDRAAWQAWQEGQK